MTDVHRVEGLFRERSQAALAIAEAHRRGLSVPAHGDLIEDPTGVHVIVGTSGSTEEARRLLLEYGAYRASVL